jgi:CheY-like chemotaxis protein
MIVDDEPDQIYTIKISLEDAQENFNISSANSGKECIELLNNNEIPDIILLDIMMPGMNGWDVLKKIRAKKSWKDIPVIFLTAKTDEIFDKHGKIIPDDYVEKPFDISDLTKKIKKLLN